MKDNEQKIFDWISAQLKLINEDNTYKGCVENQRQDYNIRCLELLSEAIKRFPNQTFMHILLNCGLLDANIDEESNFTLGRIRRRKTQIKHWDELNFCDGLQGLNINESISTLYEYQN